MRRLTSENDHYFTKKLFSKINAYSVENLSMDFNRNFTAVIEACEFNSDEDISIANVYTPSEIDAKCLLAKKLNIPFYYVAYKDEVFTIFSINSSSKSEKLTELDSKGFTDWYRKVKGSYQTHPMVNGGDLRINDSIFYKVLSADNQMWGGNIDGFVVKDNEIICVIDNISINFAPMDNPKAHPAPFFFKRGPRYETWLSTVKLAISLNVPHILLTINKKNPQEEIVGLTVIKELTHGGIYYVDNVTPPERLIRGVDKISEEIFKFIKISKPPKLS